MACTTQSALDYIKSARVHLVRELKSLSVIVENLYQRRVFSDEEVSKIQAERDDYDKTRKILDSVTKMGEAACYEFLRIIDKTRKRTLERISLLPETKSSASTETEKFDLHHWISCFSFKEDTQMDINYSQGPRPCLRYQAKLKSKAQKISKDFWMANKTLFEGNNKPDLSYSELVLDTQGSVSPSKIKKFKSKKSRMSRPKKLRTYIPEDKPEISPGDLLKTDKNILLVGKPGIGKTALTHEMLKLWAERDNEELDYMFYFDMRETSHDTSSLEHLLFSVFSEPDEGKEEVLEDIKKNSDNVTIIFDGITDLSSSVVKKLVEKDLLPDAKVIVTCRPDDEGDFLSGDFLRVEVKGFSEQTIKTYLSALVGEEQEKVLSSLELLSLCHVPVYALMVAACFSSETPENSPQPCSITEIYINIVCFCLQTNSNKRKNKLNSFIKNKSEEILSLAEAAFNATEGRTVNLTELPCEDSCVLSFLKPLDIKVAPTETKTIYAFLHYTMQEFFAALWLLKNPDKIKDVFQQCLTEEMKHMKHLIPFMCRLLTENNPSLMTCLIPAQELKNTSNWFFKELITTLFPCLCNQDEADTEDSGPDVDILFLCQCFYESQCPEACVYFLDKLDYCLDLSGESLDPYPCCAVAYVVAQSKERKIQLNLEDVTVSEQGMTRLFGCLKNVQWCDPLPRQLWEIFLLSEAQMDHISLLGLDGNQLHLPVEGKRQLFERAVKVMQKTTTKINVCLHWGKRETPVCQRLCESLLEALPHISSLSFRTTYRGSGLQDQDQCHGTLEREEQQLLLDLCLRAALHKGESFHNVVNTLLSLFSVNTDLNNILLDLYQHVKSKGCSSVIPKLRPLFQSAPAVWSINLSERKTSILLEVLKLQPEKKQVELTGLSHEDSEVRSFLQCLPYISQLSFVPQLSEPSEQTRFFGNLFCAAAEREQQTGEKILELLSSVCSYETFTFQDIYDDDDDDEEYRCDSLLDLCSHLKDYETKTGLSVLPSLQSVFQSAPAVWFINLSKRKTSILLEVLKLQSEKKQVELTGCSDEESEVRSFLQCLSDISHLRLSEEIFQQLLSLLHEVQDKDLTWSLLSKVGGDLSSCCLNWELLHYLLQQSSAQTITVNLRNSFLQESITRLFPFLDRIVFKRPCPSFVLTAIREIYKARAGPIIPSLLRSFDHVINLTCREMDSVDCAALVFTLKHSDRVKLNLLWTSIPTGETESILFTLDKVSHLSVDRNLLLRFVHCCAASDAQQGAAVCLLRTVQRRLDLSCSSFVELDQEDQSETLSLTGGDCRAVSTILRRSSQDAQLDLRDCEVEDSGLDLLFPVLDRVSLRASKAVLLQLVSLVPVNSEGDTVRRAVSLCGALGGELDLSHTTLDQRACGALALMLDSSEGLTELDLSHCELTDQLLLTLITHLHKVQVLDLSHNKITDASTGMLLQLVSINPSMDTVRLFRNNIVDRTSFEKDKRFEIW